MSCNQYSEKFPQTSITAGKYTPEDAHTITSGWRGVSFSLKHHSPPPHLDLCYSGVRDVSAANSTCASKQSTTSDKPSNRGWPTAVMYISTKTTQWRWILTYSEHREQQAYKLSPSQGRHEAAVFSPPLLFPIKLIHGWSTFETGSGKVSKVDNCFL